MAASSLRRALVAALTACCAASQAQTQSIDPCVAGALAAPWAQLSRLREQQKLKANGAQRCQPPKQLPQVVDKSPPVVTAFNADESLDVTKVSADMGVAFKGIDDLSGVLSVMAGAHGPSGQQITVGYFEAVPKRKVSGLMLSGASFPYLEPGTYTFDALYITDVANNTAFYDAAAIAALGRSSFTVENKRGFDTTPPALVRGRVLTPKVSLSDTQPGTEQSRFVGVEVESVDHGNTATAGFYGAYMYFCLLNDSSCIVLDGSGIVGVRSDHEGKATIRLGTQLSYGNLPPGDYHIRDYHATDRAGNAQNLTSQEFGGETDFSAYFPSLFISIKP